MSKKKSAGNTGMEETKELSEAHFYTKHAALVRSLTLYWEELAEVMDTLDELAGDDKKALAKADLGKNAIVALILRDAEMLVSSFAEIGNGYLISEA